MKPINFKNRIAKATKLLANDALVIFSQPTAYRNADNAFEYRQHSFLNYLTGFREAESALVLTPAKPKGEQVTLFLNDKDPVAELWNGKRLGVAAAPAALAIEKAYPIGEVWKKLPELLKGSDKVHYHFGDDENRDRNFIAAIKKETNLRPRFTPRFSLSVVDSEIIAGKLRICKEPEEVDRMKRAIAITKNGFDEVLAVLRPGMNEREIQGILVGAFFKGGAEMVAYPPIVASGDNACCLHYHENCAELKKDDLILIDAGSQFDYYASDVTRTFPISPKFSPAQKDLYALVLDANKQAIAGAKVGSTLQQVHSIAQNVLADGLIHLKILKTSKAEAIEKGEIKTYYPHGTSHWLGLDVHDVGDISLPLEPGMVFTVEPGIYIDRETKGAPPAFLGLGIRIEDDILISENGPIVLTAEIPKNLDAIQRHS